MTTALTYLVYSPPYNENAGGTIFLHALVHHLRTLGQRAYLVPEKARGKRPWYRRLKHRLMPPPFPLNPKMDTGVAPPRLKANAPDTVVIYPEIVDGNPLGARNVVRWLLYTPGALGGPTTFGARDMFFTASAMADDLALTGGAPELFTWQVNPVYHNEGRPDRRGVCYIVRKGDAKPRIPQTQTPDAIQIDDLSHAEINEIFNRSSVFYSYDEATMYSQFAVLTGCLSVVIPGLYASRAEWVAAHELARFGVAYGTDDAELEHARSTQAALKQMLQDKEQMSIQTVRRFITLTQERYL